MQVKNYKISRSKKLRLVNELKATHGTKCFYCLREMSFIKKIKQSKDFATLEHLQDSNNSSQNTRNHQLDNLVLACHECNRNMGHLCSCYPLSVGQKWALAGKGPITLTSRKKTWAVTVWRWNLFVTRIVT